MLKLTSRLVVAGAAGPGIAFAAQSESPGAAGLVAGEVSGAEAGNKVLREGGNAIDAAVTAALVACVVVPNGCGIGGYGGHMVIAPAGGKKTIAIDFNTSAPATARPDMFQLDDRGLVRARINEYGWLSAGVPGTLAGLQRALDRYGTRSFREMVAPAIRLAEEGFPISEGLARGIRAVVNQLRKDPGSAKLLLKDGEPLQAGDRFRNPNLAKMLEKLARYNSVEPFYSGDIARRIAEEFHKHGGLVTAMDLAGYQAREVEPLEFEWRGLTIRTAPLTAGGLTVLQALSILKALDWDKRPASGARTHALVEALRLSWHDRLQQLGDPEKANVPVARLLAEEYVRSLAAKIERTVQDRRPLPLQADSRRQSGTVHLNSADRHGNTVALTLTHGNTFGACVTVEGLGLTLGHGMSRFDPRPNHPNSPGPGKRPLDNMCPTIVLSDGRPLLALGATGGRKIPNALFGVLTHYVGLGASASDAVAAPRLHTEGGLDLTLERAWPESETELLKAIGYTVNSGNSAIVHAISFDPQTRAYRAAAR